LARKSQNKSLHLRSKLNILITGGEGLIGRELQEVLEFDDCKVYILDIKNGQDVMNYETCKQYCTGMDQVYHLFGIKGNPHVTKNYPASFMLPMLQGDTNMIRAAVECGVKTFLYTSSIAVEHPQTDEYPAWAKQTAEKLIDALRIQKCKTEFVIVRPSNVYGPYDNFDNKHAMVITSLVKQAVDKGKITQIGKGDNIRDFIHARDVAMGMKKAMTERPIYPVNLCSGDGVSIAKIIELVAKESNAQIEKLDSDEYHGDKVRVMKQNWEFKPMIQIGKGIREVVNAYRNSTDQR
jgi:GDP-L-fucose synthase